MWWLWPTYACFMRFLFCEFLSIFMILLHEEMTWNVEITVFQHTPCPYLATCYTYRLAPDLATSASSLPPILLGSASMVGSTKEKKERNWKCCKENKSWDYDTDSTAKTEWNNQTHRSTTQSSKRKDTKNTSVEVQRQPIGVKILWRVWCESHKDLRDEELEY